MSNKYLYMVMAALFGVLWWYVGKMPYFADMAGDVSSGWIFSALVAVGLGAGSTGGTCVPTIFIEGIKGYVSTLIALTIFSAVGGTLYLFITVGMFDYMRILAIIATTLVAATITNMMLSYLKKATA